MAKLRMVAVTLKKTSATAKQNANQVYFAGDFIFADKPFGTRGVKNIFQKDRYTAQLYAYLQEKFFDPTTNQWQIQPDQTIRLPKEVSAEITLDGFMLDYDLGEPWVSPERPDKPIYKVFVVAFGTLPVRDTHGNELEAGSGETVEGVAMRVLSSFGYTPQHVDKNATFVPPSDLPPVIQQNTAPSQTPPTAQGTIPGNQNFQQGGGNHF